MQILKHIWAFISRTTLAHTKARLLEGSMLCQKLNESDANYDKMPVIFLMLSYPDCHQSQIPYRIDLIDIY